MTSDRKSTMVGELLADYVDERVRQFPTAAFDLAGVKRSLDGALTCRPEIIERSPPCWTGTHFFCAPALDRLWPGGRV